MAVGLENIKTLTNEMSELNSIREILEVAIQREESAHAFYLMAHDKACNKIEKELFLKLAQEELLHKQNLARQLDEVKARMFTDQALSGGEFGTL
jgi:rubrerythrin